MITTNGGSELVVELWRISDEAVESTAQNVDGDTGAVSHVSIDSSGRWLIAKCHNDSVAVWDLTAQDVGHAPSVIAAHQHLPYFVRISKGGRWLITANAGGPIRLWPLIGETTSQSLMTLPASGDVNAIELDNDGRWLAASHSLGSVLLWDLEARGSLLRPQNLTHFGPHNISTLTFSPNSNFLIGASPLANSGRDYTRMLWVIGTDLLLERARGLAGRTFTANERQKYALDDATSIDVTNLKTDATVERMYNSRMTKRTVRRQLLLRVSDN